VSGRERVLVVNADDFGLSAGVNRGVARAHEEGIVTSATLMVRAPAAAEAANYAREHPSLSVGLHLDLGEWVYDDGHWQPRYEVVPPGDEEAIALELAHQLETFQQLVGRAPTHLDSHQHVHRDDPARTLLARAGHRLGVPVRHVTPDITYDGSFYGQDGRGEPVTESISVEALVALIGRLAPGATELGCHPGEGGDLDTTYGRERERETATLCDPRIRAAIEAQGVELRSFAQLG
jgi:predicted glycoside hydrolase/deacetylase ChbG (UPF0249 family)